MDGHRHAVVRACARGTRKTMPSMTAACLLSESSESAT
ncbi:hypothetical protein RSPO_c02912 [Ralstonia solanacearum Po82]|uniref:Uncharacterized protein n=1 Tax=Ralstonia solanacearum (strain Po82) TaxID=1031711 RepID=F6G5A4_RALS8|nr:hypothetical protein RSPO_c02912 [Ralstonia solanacearum Po82]